MAQQTSGWAGTPNAAGITVQDAFQRNLLMKYGGRTDNIWDYHDFEGYKKELRWGLGSPGSQYASSFKNSGMAPSFGGRNTPSDPGSYNWDTLNKGLNRAAGIGWGLVDWRMANKRNAVAKQKNQMKQNMQNYADAMSSWDPTNNYNMAYSSAYGAAYGAAQPSSAPNSGAATNTSQKTRNPARRKTSPKINSPKP